MTKDRTEALAVLRQHITSDQLIKHCLAVEAAMRAYARNFGEDEHYWGMVGLLHDIDFERYPEEHPAHAGEILSRHGYDAAFINDVLAHGRDWPHDRTLLQKTLLAVDEMTGFVIACALVRPDKSLDNLEPKSVIKKMKDKAFARAVNRETMVASAAALGVPLEEHIRFVTRALAEAVRQPEYEILKPAGM